MTIDDLAIPVHITAWFPDTADLARGLQDLVIIGVAPCALIGALESRFHSRRTVTVTLRKDECPNLLEWRPEWGDESVMDGHLTSLIVQRECEPHHVEIAFTATGLVLATRPPLSAQTS